MGIQCLERSGTEQEQIGELKIGQVCLLLCVPSARCNFQLAKLSAKLCLALWTPLAESSALRVERKPR